MLVMILEKAPTSLRGALSRWLIQLRPGMFLGNPSRRVRDELWMKACKKLARKAACCRSGAPATNKASTIGNYGKTDQLLLDYEGLTLVTKLRRTDAKAQSQIGAAK